MFGGRSSMGLPTIKTCRPAAAFGHVRFVLPRSAKDAGQRFLPPSLIMRGGGGQVLLLNLTFPHGMGDDLYTLLGRMSKAVDYVLRGSRAAKALYSRIGCVGTIRALEVTYGSNGFHPHFHILLFVKKGLQLHQVEADFFDLWERGCHLAHLGQPDRRRCPLQDGSHAAEYAAKGTWGLDREMTKGHIKKSRKGYSPFDLLRVFAFGAQPDGASIRLDKNKAARVFRIYAEAFKGKRQLVWSKGLKARFAIKELSDDALAVRLDDESIFLGQFELEDWKRIVAAEGRGLVLELARTGGWEAILLYLQGLKAPQVSGVWGRIAPHIDTEHAP